MLIYLRRTIDKHSKNFNKDGKYKKVPNERQNWTEKQIQGVRQENDEIEAKISEMKDKAMKTTQTEQQSEKRINRNEDTLRDL